MYQLKQIHYKSIFKQDGDTETIEYKSQGVIYKEENTKIIFQQNNQDIQIQYGKGGILLKNGPSTLRFEINKDIWNEYELPYGHISLKTKLLKFETDENHIKMKYELYDTTALISTVYIWVRIMPIGEGL